MSDESVTIRPARAGDLAAIARIMNYPPEPPMATLLGETRASRLGALFVRSGAVLTLSHTSVAVVAGAVAGVLECGTKPGGSRSAGIVLRVLPQAVWMLRTATPRAVQGLRLQGRVEFEPQPGAFPVGQLYVDEALRNRGIGGRLLEYAEELAHHQGAHRMTIETGITNPARRLYERHGYAVIETKADRDYERMTGSPGRILMAKDI